MRKSSLLILSLILFGCSSTQNEEVIKEISIEYSDEALSDYFSNFEIQKEPNFEKPEIEKQYLITRTNNEETIKEFVTFTDTTKPTINFDNPQIGFDSENHVVVAGITINDNYDDEIIPVVYGIDPNVYGKYRTAVSATDSNGNKESITVEIECVPTLEGNDTFIDDTLYLQPIDKAEEVEPEAPTASSEPVQSGEPAE